MPTLYMLVGIPASGKSTWRNKQSAPVVSSDDHIERLCAQNGKTYTEGFKEFVGLADRLMKNDVDNYVAEGTSFIWDQTNLNAKTRKGKLARVPSNWRKVAVVFEIPDKKELQRRLATRPDKFIPEGVLDSMISKFRMPTKEEGFDDVVRMWLDEAYNV